MTPEIHSTSSGQVKTCQNCKQNFTIESEDLAFYEKIKVPVPTFCPKCRFQRRLLLRNERFLYKRQCDLCKKNIISVYNQDQNFPVYCQDCWWSEKWDALNYGKKFDFSIPFFNQFKELFSQVPQIALNGHQSNINSEYVNYIIWAKNSYLCFGGGYLEDVLFSTFGVRLKNSAEIYFSFDCEFCYQILGCRNCSHISFAQNCKDCYDSYFIKDCVNCHDCILCSGLRNKSYCYENRQLTREEFLVKKKEFEELLQADVEVLKEKFKDIDIKVPKKNLNINKSENCLGDNISNSKDCIQSYNIIQGENCKYSNDITGAKDIYDVTSAGINVEKLYEVMTGSINISQVLFSSVIRNNSLNINYSIGLNSCSDCFGCVGLNKKHHCIFNKQYTKEEYEELVPKIIKHMEEMPYIDKKGRVYKYGEFFPPELSPFSYNETIAQEYFPLTKEQAIEQGYSWKDPEERNIKIDIKSEDLPDHIKDVNDDILNKVIECQHKGKDCNEQCTEAFKIIPQELEFYRKMNLPLPRLCPNCRHYQRLKQRNPLKLWHRKCMCNGNESRSMNNESGIKYTNTIIHQHGTEPCPNEFETTYSPDRKEIVYCEHCYQQEVV